MHRRPRSVARVEDGQEGFRAGEAEAVRVWLLGGLRVLVGSRQVDEGEWRLKKARSLIKLLALAPGHRMHRERVMDRLWPELGRAEVANNLRRVLYVARRAFEPSPATPYRYLRLKDEVLALCPDGPLWVDVEAFEEAAEAARRIREPAAYRVAIELYIGELLPEDRYEEWSEGRREELQGLYLALLVEMAALLEERGEHDEAIEALRRVLSHEPAREEAHAGLMRLYALSGQRGEALRQYERLKESLSREFGTEPVPPSQRLREQIAAGRFPPTTTPSSESGLAEEAPIAGPHNLPAAPDVFVGREREVIEVKRALSMTNLLTLTGAGGSGKTRLALQVAKDLVGFYPDGTWLVELAPLSEGELVPQAVAEPLGVREQPGRPLADTLVDGLKTKKVLLLLDNCEHLIGAAARLAYTLLTSCPRLRILATSREPLGVAGEMNWQVPPLSVPGTGRSPATDDLMRYESVRLFMERARLRLPAFELTRQNAGAVAEVCRKLDGIPLAIELASARITALAVEQVAQRLEESLKLLTGGARTAAPRQQTMRATLEWSHDLLPEPERVLFRRLSVFAGGWALEAAEAVGEGSGIERGEVLDLLSRLVDKSLVVAETSSQRGALRYRMLEPIRQYAREKLEESGEADAVRRRHVSWCLALAEEAEPEVQGAQAERWLRRLEAEHDNLRAALTWALTDGDEELGLRLAATLGGFWQMRGHLKEAWRWLEAALSKGDTPAPTRVKALAQAAFMGVEQGEFERSIALSEEALAVSRETGDEAGAAAALYNLGYATMFQEEQEKAKPMFEEAVALRRKLGDNVGLAYALQGLGLTVMVQGDFERAVALFEEGLAREAGDMAVTELLLLALALAALGQDDYERAREICAKASELARRLDYGHATAANLHVLASAAGSEGQQVRAARLWGAAEALREAIGATLSPVERTFYARHIAAARDSLDDAAWEASWAEGRKMTPEEAVEYGLPAEEPTLPASLRSARVKALSWASWMAWEQGGDFERAAALGEEGLALAREMGDTAGVVAGLQNMGIVALRQNELGRSQALFEESVALQREMGDTAGVARSLQALGLIAVTRRDHERAQALFEEGLALNQETGDRMGAVLLLALGALTALGRGAHRQTRELCAQGLEISRRFGMRHGIVFHLQILACLAGAQAQAVRAARLWGAAEALGEAIGVRLVPVERYHYGPYIAAARDRLDDAAWEAAWAEGQNMTLERAVEYALESEEEPSLPTPPSRERTSAGKLPHGLTRREKEISALLARGLTTNRQIASELVISERTVETHVRNILKKLGLKSRSQLAVWAAEQRLGSE